MQSKISEHKNVRMFLINNFLDNTFDDCLEEAVSLYIESESHVNKKLICEQISKFISCDIDKEIKNKFIMHNAGICYELIEKEPLQWLSEIRDKISEEYK